MIDALPGISPVNLFLNEPDRFQPGQRISGGSRSEPRVGDELLLCEGFIGAFKGLKHEFRTRWQVNQLFWR